MIEKSYAKLYRAEKEKLNRPSLAFIEIKKLNVMARAKSLKVKTKVGSLLELGPGGQTAQK